MTVCSSCGKENPADAAFCMACAASLGGSVASHELRKLVTALFCDLVGSTMLGETNDLEVLRPVLDNYFAEMRSAAERHGGRVEKFIGDAVVVIFGLPVAHEDDALRAARVGLEMQDRLRRLNETSPIPLAARIGVTTGELLVRGDHTLIGDVMNTASRLQTAAEPGEVLIGEPTWRLVRTDVDADPVEPLFAKGKAEPILAWRLLAVRQARSTSATPFVGRDRHLRLLQDALEDAWDARASVLVTVLAPPGVGKSRLAAAFASQLGERATVLVGQTPSYGEGVTFAPLVELLAQAASRPSGGAGDVAAALRERMADQPDGASVADRLAQFLGIGEALGADSSWAVRRLLEVLAFERPLVVLLEDVHWAEPPMLDLIDSVVEHAHGAMLFLCLARPEFLEQRPNWAAGKPRAITSTLPPLTPGETRRVAEHLLGGKAPASVVDRVCESAEGNPLYLEQLTAMLADQGVLIDGVWLDSADAEVEIPETLQALLAARLDRLHPEQSLIIEKASVEGRRFRVASVRALARELSRDDVVRGLASLERSGFVQSESGAEGRWRFAHALVLEAVYRRLSKGQRAKLHEQLADWMQEEDADQSDVNESVARHLERALHLREEIGLRDERSAMLSERAGELFAAAGSRAFAALDFITTRDLLGRAAALLPDRDPRRLDLLPNLGVALTETGRPEETEALLADAIQQSRAAGSERDALRATIQLLSNRVYRSPTDAEVDAAILETEAAADVLEAMGDDVGVAEAAITAEYLEYMRGCVARQHQWAFRALRHALTAGRLRESAQAAADIVGSAVDGPVPFDRFASIAEEQVFPFDEPISASAGHAMLAIGSLAAGDEAEFHEHEERRREVVDRHGLSWLGATHGLCLAIVETSVGKADAAERRLRETRNVLAALGDIWWVSQVDSALCAAVWAQDRSQEFLRLVDAFEASAHVPDRQIQIRRSLIRSRSSLLRGSAADAEIAAKRGLELAKTTDLVLDRADALLTLADVHEARGQSDKAATARGEAVERFRAKGNLAAVVRLSGAS